MGLLTRIMMKPIQRHVTRHKKRQKKKKKDLLKKSLRTFWAQFSLWMSGFRF